MEIITIFVIAISLSMDAFSLASAYGTIGLIKRDILKLSIIVGIFHFFMPLLGMGLGIYLLHIFPIKPSVIVFLILASIGVQMIIESFKEERTSKIMTFGQLLLFGFAVSVDSFSVGIGLKVISQNIWLCISAFSICSFIFTYLGLYLGKKLGHLLGKMSTIFGGIVLIIVGSIYLFN